MNNARSLDLLIRAKKITPCAAQTYSKSYRYYCEGIASVFLEKGQGSHVWDVDGNEYIDFVSALGAIILGYNNPVVNQAIIDQLEKGIAFSEPTEVEVQLAEKLIDIIPSAEMVRFVKNGSDATSSAVRLARAYTNKNKIAVCGYHGYHDWYISSTENDLGIPHEIKKLTLLFEYNNINSVEKLFEQNPDQVAAVILEPCQGNGPENDFLNKIKEIAHSNGALLIFDEVVSGFRFALNGAQGLFNVTPDLTALGKGMGNGLPISAIVGSKIIMELIEEGAFISTTHGGEALSLAGALATIETLENEDCYDHMRMIGKKLKEGLIQIVKELSLENILQFPGLDIHFSTVFQPTGSLTSLDLLSLFQQTMFENHVIVLTTNTLCYSHNDDDVNKYIGAAKKSLELVKLAIENDSLDGLLKGGKIRPIFKRDKSR